ncbi:anoctamin-4-like [Haliotis rubra]|uniref:anoctamin-4-like n=1 Tax=Haliotis rubra TaxID=36100 RepID=UPI001EE556DF|nr:anoctamin-4-like [Haliotis rubra]
MAEMQKLIKADLVLRISNSEKQKSHVECLRSQGFSVDFVTDVATKTQYVLLRCSFVELCREAEKMKLQMPLKGEKAATLKSTCLSIPKFFEDHLATDNEVDLISAPFVQRKGDKFDGFDNKQTFFRPSLRSLLAHRILSEYNASPNPNVKGIPLKDCLIPHAITVGASCSENRSSSTFRNHSNHKNSSNDYKEYDKMEQEWASFKKFYKFQPLWKIRNYFGEKIAFYFAWIGFFITSLWIPVLTGLIVFFYGVGLRVASSVQSSGDRSTNGTEGSVQSSGDRSTNGTEGIKMKLFELMNFIHLTFDNGATPFFAMLVCIWGTFFLEFWKRKSSRLAFEWDVKDLQTTEPDRPDYNEPNNSGISKTLLQCGRISISVAVAILMVAVVVASVVGVVIYKITLRIDICPGYNEHECLILTTIMSSFINAISITLLGKLYKRLAVRLNEKENHKSQSKHDDALIMKLFAFEFANSYSSCFLHRFHVREGRHVQCDWSRRELQRQLSGDLYVPADLPGHRPDDSQVLHQVCP